MNVRDELVRLLNECGKYAGFNWLPKDGENFADAIMERFCVFQYGKCIVKRTDHPDHYYAVYAEHLFYNDVPYCRRCQEKKN